MINKSIVLGYLGKDPELRQTTSGHTVATINVATSKKFTDKNGNQQQVTTWHRVILWNKLAEIAGKYLKKGSQVYIEGEIQHREYEKDGEKRFITEIVAKQLQMLGGNEKPKAETNQQTFDDFGQEPSFDEHEEIPF